MELRLGDRWAFVDVGPWLAVVAVGIPVAIFVLDASCNFCGWVVVRWWEVIQWVGFRW